MKIRHVAFCAVLSLAMICHAAPASADILVDDDVQAYSRARGVPIETAELEMTLQGMAEVIAPALEDDPRVTAFWIDTSKEWSLRVGVRSAVDWPEVRSLLPREISAVSMAVVQRFSDDELGRIAASVQEAAIEQGLSAGASVSAINQTVTLTLSEHPSESQRSSIMESTSPLGLSDFVIEVIVDPKAIPQPAALLYGGLDGSGCTTGFSVTNGVYRGMLTAAHCPEPAHVWGHTLPMMQAWADASREIQWHTGESWTNLIYDGEGVLTRSITSQLSRAALVLSGTYCHRGQTTNYSCGRLASKTEPRPWWVPAGTSNTWLAIDGGKCAGGDSGGPVFINQAAVGILSGCAGSRVVAMSIDVLSGTPLAILKVA